MTLIMGAVIIKKELTKCQEKCVYYKGGKPLLIKAGPGAGKTFVLTERVKYLLEKEKKNPESFLIITFSVKAAEELKVKLSNKDIPEETIKKMQISTIHSFCLKLLEDPKRNHKREGYKIYSDDNEERMKLFLKNHLKCLGFENEYFANASHVSAILDKYDEYTMYNVDTEGLVEYIKETRKIEPKYVEIVNEGINKDHKFPSKFLKLNKNKKEYKGVYKSWYNARYLKVAESYPDYLKLLDDHHITDFNRLQLDALDSLREIPESQYTNIFIDEFQDTDPIQIQIFEILMKEAIKSGGSFTAVGDADQRIYGFRGSLSNYFDYMIENYDVDTVVLDYNHRSTNEIIGLSEDFIKHQRSNNEEFKGRRNDSKSSFYMKNASKEEEAHQICELIKNLIEHRNLKYEDIAILTRSVKHNHVSDLIASLKSNDIPHQIKGFNDLDEQDEVQSILFLLNYLVEDEDEISVYEPLNLKGFAGNDFNQVFVDLSEKTKEIICKKQDDFEKSVLEMDKNFRVDISKCKEIYKSKNLPNYGNISKFESVFEKRDDDYIIKLMSFVERPSLKCENLIEYGITDEDDLEFFKKLNELKEMVKWMPKKYELDDEARMENLRRYFYHTYGLKKIPTISDIYYELIRICDFIDLDNIYDPDYREKIENIALITHTISNYEAIDCEYDLAGLCLFLKFNIGSYETNNKENHGVQIMTVHKSKGLEFPVTILLSLGHTEKGNKSSFPRVFISPKKRDNIHMKDTYYTPSEYLEYKDLSIEEEEKASDEEEERIIYVAMTRAQDVLVLSSIVNEEYSTPECIQSVIDNNPALIKHLTDNFEDIPSIESSKDKEEEDKLTLSYTSMSSYNDCPLRYKLFHDFDFRVSTSPNITYGTIAHKSLDKINKMVKEGKFSEDKIDKIVDSSFKSNFEGSYKEEDVNRIKNSIHNYWNDFGKNRILDSEYHFDIKRKKFDLVGSIDLIYETENGNLGLIDYKVSHNIKANKDKYEKQLNIYKLALDLIEDGEYSGRNIERLSVYSVLDNELIDFEVGNIDQEGLLEEIESIADDILDDKYCPRRSESCKYCKFNFICCD